MKKVKILMTALTSLIAVTSANAASISGNMNTSATVENSCFLKVEDMDFGLYDLHNPIPLKLTRSNVNVLCNKTTSITVKLNFNSNSIGFQRYLMHPNGIDKIAYNIYRKSGLAEVLVGENILINSEAKAFIMTTNGENQSIPLIFKMGTNNTLVAPGVYSDQLMLSLDY